MGRSQLIAEIEWLRAERKIMLENLTSTQGRCSLFLQAMRSTLIVLARQRLHVENVAEANAILRTALDTPLS